MLFSIAAALGLASAATRSTGTLVITGLMIPLVFAAACIVSPAALPLMGLWIAILGFNLGVAMLLGGHIIREVRRRAA
ncbi:hypothetical protein [Rhizobium oryzicola]|uniref:Transmembrane protein n=1 Tax=Rhizobium oryzicola TaxID=1232668 RepID=A0ABT8SQF6_9HYPH|nr:hypothetical protein [Rhizobium oryzicola]MDO1580694.1 hypothetical protein [Rhizobium oryzicola]